MLCFLTLVFVYCLDPTPYFSCFLLQLFIKGKKKREREMEKGSLFLFVPLLMAAALGILLRAATTVLLKIRKYIVIIKYQCDQKDYSHMPLSEF